MGEFAYGFPDKVRSPGLNRSVESIQSSYEVQENLEKFTSNKTLFESVSSEYFTPESLDTKSLISSIDVASNLPPSENQFLLSDLLKSVSTTSNKSVVSTHWDKLNSSKTNKDSSGQSIKSKKSADDQGDTEIATNIYSFIKTASSDDNKAEVVQDPVFKNKQTYTKLPNKLKKLQLSEEENRFMGVVNELENVLKKKNVNKLSKYNDEDTNIPDSLKTDSTNCEVKSEAKLFHSIPRSRKLEKIFRKATCTSIVNQELVDQMTNHSDTRSLQHLRIQRKSLDLQDAIINLDQIQNAPDNSSYFSTSPLIRTTTNQSQKSEYNEHNFLTAAPGEELLTGASLNAVVTNSSIDRVQKHRCKNHKSTNTISNTYEEKSRKSYTVDRSSNCPSYNEINPSFQETSTSRSKKLIKNKIFVHENIANQAERAIEYGRSKTSDFVGSPAHLEAERTLLVSKIRRQALISTLYTNKKTPNEETLGRVTIENLRCTLITAGNGNHSSEQYYVCILQYKSTVYSTKIAAPNRLGWVDFGGCFIFDDVTNTFNIKIELHSIKFSQGPRKCFVFPFLRSSSKLPMMKLNGETYIGIKNKNHEQFSLIYLDGFRFREHNLTASIQTSVKWPDTLRGFLTIGIEKQDQQAIWNRRWCVLEDGQLKYYNYPSDESYSNPAGALNLATCRSCDESNKRYLRHKSISLFIESGNEIQIYYMSPDSTEEFHKWSRHLDVVLKLVKKWNLS